MVDKIFLFSVVGIMCSCASSESLEKELAGVWKSKDGAVLVLNADSTFSVTKLPAGVVELSYGRSDTTRRDGSLLTYRGRWETSTWYGDERFSLRPNTDSSDNKAYKNVGFMVFRSGFLQNGHPNRLQIYLDSDGVDVYEFRRGAVNQ